MPLFGPCPCVSALFAGSRVWADAAAPEVTLRGVDGDTLRALVGAVYTRRLEARTAPHLDAVVSVRHCDAR